VLGPIAVFFILTSLFQQSHLNRGWGIPTATDIALAWLGARLLCGEKHPAVDYLLLLAIVDDGIGLGIIAVFYGDPLHPLEGWYLLSVGLGSGLAYLLRRWGVQQWPVYIFGAGAFSWWGLHQAHLHPALALVGIVPFLPTSVRRVGLFREERSPRVSAMQSFGHQLKIFVDFGLFFFAFANAGLEFSAVAEISWIIFASLLIGKTLGISLVGIAAQKIGFSLPRGMRTAHLVVVGMLAGIGLTVALFVCGAAYTHELAYAQGPAKMGALFSVGAFVVAAITARVLGVLRRAPQDDKGTSASG
jgi:NhaA family Na+:H+ antiporter